MTNYQSPQIEDKKINKRKMVFTSDGKSFIILFEMIALYFLDALFNFNGNIPQKPELGDWHV